MFTQPYIYKVIDKETQEFYIGSQCSGKIICIETGKVYNSVKEAELVNNSFHISRCCSGKRKTSGGYHWQYYKS